MDAAELFHLTGRRTDAALGPIDGRGLRPALFARLRDLTRLRYDYPLVLMDGDPVAVTLSGLFDETLDKIGPSQRTRRLARIVEREIRVLTGEGVDGTLGALWDLAASRLAARDGEQALLDLLPLRSALPVDGQVADCDASLPARLVTHLWRAVERERARSMGTEIDALAARLSQLVRADYMRSEVGRAAPALRAAIGVKHQELFDFEAMAQLLAKPSGPIGLSEARRRRIATALAVLRGQRFFGERAWSFSFRRMDAALAAFRERLPLMADLVRAIGIAELELAGAYVESTHDPLFASFDEAALGRDDIARFPSYLVRVDADDRDGTTRALLFELLTSGAAVKVLLDVEDVFGLAGRLATTALGLGDAFVVQSASAGLFRQAGAIRAALAYPGASLVSVFTGAGGSIPAYLVSAVATESRAFPTFSYDPVRSPDLARRLSIDGAPQPELRWPVHPFTYADDALQRVEEPIAVTPVDLALCVPALQGCFAEAPRSAWTPELVPAAKRLDGPHVAVDGVPFVWAVDGDARLRRLVVDERLMRAARRMGDAWDLLVEIARPRALPAASVEAPQASAVAQPPAAVEPVEDSTETARGSDEPYIETPRCTTCNECTTLNGRMFAYNENRQAYIADPSAGTYRELVEAAEGCQVAIIHPGKPRDPNEPGLADLLARAESFR